MTSNPKALKRLHSITQHGQTRNDEYYWMRERTDPNLMQYLQAENEHLERLLEHIKPLQEKLFQEMKDRIKEVDSSVPEKKGDYFYYKRTEADKQYPIYCRKKESLASQEEILLDQNLLAEGHEFCSVSAFNVSPDQSKLAYSVDLEGAEVYTVFIKNLIDGSHYPEKIIKAHGSAYYPSGLEWANDSECFYYLSLNPFHRAYKLFRHKLGTDPAQDRLLFHEEDDVFSISLLKTRSAKYIMTHHYNTISHEMRFLPADDPDAELIILQPRPSSS